MKTIELALAMKRIGIEHLIIEKALKDMAELARLNGLEIWDIG